MGNQSSIENVGEDTISLSWKKYLQSLANQNAITISHIDNHGIYTKLKNGAIKHSLARSLYISKLMIKKETDKQTNIMITSQIMGIMKLT